MVKKQLKLIQKICSNTFPRINQKHLYNKIVLKIINKQKYAQND